MINDFLCTVELDDAISDDEPEYTDVEGKGI